MEQDLDLMTILDAAKKAGEAVASSKMTSVGVQEQMDKTSKAVAQMSVNLDGLGLADTVITAQKHAFAAETDSKKQAAEIALSSSFLDSASDANKWAARAKDNAEKAYAAMDGIKAKEAITLLDSPLDFIMNKFTLPADRAEYNMYASKHNIAEDALDRIQRQGTNAAIQAKHMERSTSSALALAEAEKIAILTQFNKNKLVVDSAPHIISGLNTINSLNAQQSDLAFRLLNAQGDQEKLAMERTRLKQASAAHALHAKEVGLRVKDRADQESYRDLSLQEYNTYQKSIGGLEEHNPLKFTAMMARRMNDPDFVSALLGGQLILRQGSKDNIPVAPTTGAAARVYAGAGVNTAGNNVGSFLAKTYNTLEGNPQFKGNPAALENAVSVAAKNKALEDMAAIKTKEPSIYLAPALGAMMQNSTVANVVMKNPFFAATVKPEFEANPNSQLDHNRMTAKYFAYVGKNPTEIKATAQALASYYSNAVLVNNQVNQYSRSMLPTQQKYMAQFDEKELDLGRKPMDLTSPLTWEKLGMDYYNRSVNSFGSSSDIFRARRDAFNAR